MLLNLSTYGIGGFKYLFEIFGGINSIHIYLVLGRNEFAVSTNIFILLHSGNIFIQEFDNKRAIALLS